jgi:hypothetical protein
MRGSIVPADGFVVSGFPGLLLRPTSLWVSGDGFMGVSIPREAGEVEFV